MSDEIERTLCQISHVFVFKIPARKSAEGYRAADWPQDPSWSGKLKIVARGSIAAIILQDDHNQVFAVCQVLDDSCVERTLDSGRYFVLKITNQQGRHAFIGIAFNERNDAFDFNVALNEFKSEVERESKATEWSAAPSNQDFTLKTGEKIKIKLNKKAHDPSSESAGEVAHATIVSKPLPSPSTAATSDPWGSDPFSGSSDPFASLNTHSSTPNTSNLLDF